MTRIWIPIIAVFALACGATADGGRTTADEATAASGDATSSWEGLDLAATVRQGAMDRLREVDPSIDPAALPGWAEDSETAPELGDRVSEQVLRLAIVEASEGDTALAAKLVRLVRARARNRNSAHVGTTLLSELARRGAEAPDAQQAAIGAVLRELPRNRFGGATVVFRLFQNEGQVDARVERLQQQLVSLETAASALFYEAILRPIVRHRDVFLGVIETVAAEHDAAPEREEHAFSTVDLEGAADAQELVVAVWDSGTQGSLFASQLYTAEDGSHGVVADPTTGQTGLNFDPGDAIVAEYAPFLQGIMDLRAGLASTDAAARVLELMASAQSAEALEALSTNLDAIAEWGHGTHVAGIMLAGVPQARMAVFRSAWAGERRLYHDRGPTDAELEAEAENLDAIIAFVRANRVRVVNASLGFSQDYVEDQLRHESETYPTDEAVRARATVVHAHRRAIWSRAIESCPETLFVVAAGNSNRDIVEYGDVPAAFTLDNLLTVGAVDRFGEWASFTNSNPEIVEVFDWGVAVPSLIPNGQTIPLSGTSMASPNVANLATKILAVNPDLSPAEVIRIIRETGEPISEPFYGRIAHEERAIARARAERGR